MSNISKYTEKAEKFYSEHKFKDAIYWYTRAIAENANAELYSERAVAFFHNRELKEALEDMNRAQELEPNRAYRYSSRAYIRDAMGDVDGAIKDYEKAIELDPEDAIAHNNLGLLVEKLGHHQKAKVIFDFADKLAQEQLGDPTAKAERPTNIQTEINKEKKETTLVAEMVKVFTSGNQFREFLKFVKNGFRLKD